MRTRYKPKQPAARSADEDHAGGEVDGKDAGRELGDALYTPAVGREVEGRPDRFRRERVGQADRDRDQRQAKEDLHLHWQFAHEERLR